MGTLDFILAQMLQTDGSQTLRFSMPILPILRRSPRIKNRAESSLIDPDQVPELIQTRLALVGHAKRFSRFSHSGFLSGGEALCFLAPDYTTSHLSEKTERR